MSLCSSNSTDTFGFWKNRINLAILESLEEQTTQRSYWRASGGAFEGTPTAPTSSNNVINTANGQTGYLLTGLTSGHYYHFVIKANNKNGSSPVSSVVGNVPATAGGFVANPIDAYNAGVCKIQPDKSVKCVGRNLQKAFNDANTNDVMTPIRCIWNNKCRKYHRYDYNKLTLLKSDFTYEHRGFDDGYNTKTSPVALGGSNQLQ